MTRRLSHVVGFDDAPFDRTQRGDVLVVGAVFSGQRLDGVLSCKVRRDGTNATRAIVACVRRSRFYPQLHAVLLQGIALAGFNVVDIHSLHTQLRRPVLVVARKKPDLVSIRSALLAHVRGGARKWRLIERAGPMEAVGGLYVQRAGISPADARAMLERLAIHSDVPEPLRTAHLIGAGITLGESRSRV
jgi:endonuclease V-like protein UPF0215 family